jgi:alkanesulfonate monooxygenase SsuD/methylene tetrahydromethanopterin reductase-like flavin-dependent oxidoreductase (luciferase family)
MASSARYQLGAARVNRVSAFDAIIPMQATERADVQVHGETIRFGVHTGQQFESFDEALELWQRAEELGYDWVSDFDHFRPGSGGAGLPCFEGTTLLAAVAARTSRVRCSILVASVAYRHPALLASAATTIDHISGGRLELGLGAGGGDRAQEQWGLPAPSTGASMDMLDEACRVLRLLWGEEVSSFDGRYYTLRDARLEPKPLQARVPLVIGGAGERRLLRIVAEHADVWNTMASDLELYRHKTAVLEQHCRDVSREPGDVRRSVMFRAVLGETEGEARDRLAEMEDAAPPGGPPLGGWLVVGTPERCVEELRQYARLGVRDFLLGARTPLDWRTIELVAAEVAPALAGQRGLSAT